MESAQAKTNIVFMLDKVNFVQRFPPKKASARIHLTSSERQFTASICRRVFFTDVFTFLV